MIVMMVKTIDDSVDNVIKMSGVILSTLRNKTAVKVDTIYPHLADIMLTNFYKNSSQVFHFNNSSERKRK